MLVPLKTYREVSLKGQNLLDFLGSQRPTLEDVRVARQYMVSEITGNIPSEGSRSLIY